MYIVTEYGVPHVASALRPHQPNRLAAMQKTWLYCRAYDADSRYEAKPDKEPSFSAFQRILAHTIYNPPSEIRVDWHTAGESSLEEIVAEVERGLKKDDDIIQQWFGADDVLRLLRSATTFEELCDRVECVCGGFEVNDRLRKVVDDILGRSRA